MNVAAGAIDDPVDADGDEDATAIDAVDDAAARRWRRGILGPVNRVAAGGITLLVLLYRGTLGGFMGGCCRYKPTCSQYMLDAVAKYGPWRGGWRGIKRIARCHPWGGWGYDPA